MSINKRMKLAKIINMGYVKKLSPIFAVAFGLLLETSNALAAYPYYENPLHANYFLAHRYYYDYPYPNYMTHYDQPRYQHYLLYRSAHPDHPGHYYYGGYYHHHMTVYPYYYRHFYTCPNIPGWYNEHGEWIPPAPMCPIYYTYF